MSPRKRKSSKTEITDYRHDTTRKNIPPAGLAAQGKVSEVPKTRYFYDPHLPPVLRFDETGESDKLPELLEIARQRPLTDKEVQLLNEALRNHQPWLEWSDKREKSWFDVDPVALHIHDRYSAQAIIKLAALQPIQRSFFADPELDYQEAVKFYRHDIDWTNRLILGDSLVVMHSLAKREDLAGKVQMIYIDPPYGIKFSSNFQPYITKRKVGDSKKDLTREIEQIKAYRDTWTLGIHTYLTYLRDRLIIARELLTDSGSIFLQISDDNLHLVRQVMDEIFGEENFIGIITFNKTSSQTAKLLASISDYVLWYAQNKDFVKFKQLFKSKRLGEEGATKYTNLQFINGLTRPIRKSELSNQKLLPIDSKSFRLDNLTSQSGGETTSFAVQLQAKEFFPFPGFWKTNEDGFNRLVKSGRVSVTGKTLGYIRYLDDFNQFPIANLWADVGGIQSRADPKIFVVQTNSKVIARCLLMTTDPGDLVLDPTCGSGTTAYIAEGWGRRWITIDTSRVAIALTRQRLLTARHDYYELQDLVAGPSGGFINKTVPHITLKSIAQNQALDSIFEKWEPVLAEKLETLNSALSNVTPEFTTKLKVKLAEKERVKGKRAITEAETRRWQLPDEKWEEWEVPFDTDPDWPEPLQQALVDYRKVWRSKMDEVDTAIAASAPQEVLVDRPEIVPNILRVSGPFTVEGIQPVEEYLDLESPVGGTPGDLESFPLEEAEPANAEAYLEKMIGLLRKDGVRFPDNKILKFDRLDPLPESILHAEGEWQVGEKSHRVAVSFGPQYGPITAKQIEQCLREAYRRGYDDLVFAGFTIDGAAQAIIQEDPNPHVRSHLAHIRPDVNMGDLLKDTPTSQLFTVSGLPRVDLEKTDDGKWTVHMQGVDIYDPLTNTLQDTQASKVAAWFLDSDYDGATFCITQAFFPDKSAWSKLARALKTVVDPQRFEAFSGTTSLPFTTGEHNRVAVKVIDPRGNEVMRIMNLDQEVEYA